MMAKWNRRGVELASTVYITGVAVINEGCDNGR